MLWRAGCGIGPTMSSAGVLKARMGLNTRSAFLTGPGVAPDDATHLLVVQMLRERWPGRHREKRKEAVDVAGRFRHEAAIPPHHVGCILERPEHRSRVVRLNRMGLEQQRRHDAEVAAAATHRPEQIGVLPGTRGHEPAVSQHDVHGEQVVDGEAALTRQMTDSAAKREAAHSGRRDDARRHGQTKCVRGVVHVAPQRPATGQHRSLLGIYPNEPHR